MKLKKNLYNTISYNELVYNRTLKNEARHKNYQLFFVLSFIIIKSLVLRLFLISNKKNKKELTIGISWSDLHQKKIKSINTKIPLIRINNFSYFKKTRNYYKINFSKTFKNAYKSSDEFNSRFLYRFYVLLEYEMLKNLTNNIDEVYIAGHLDRYACMLANLSEINHFKIHVVQHGALLIIDKQLESIPINGDVYYMYDFSIPIFKKLFALSSNSNFYPQKINSNFKGNLKKHPKLLICYGCQDSNIENNFSIIKELLKLNSTKEYVLQIIPHPRESDEVYHKFTKHKNVFISKEKDYIPNLFVTRFSTLGLEFASINIATLFVNIDQVKLDFIVSGKYNVINSIEEINLFYENVILKNEK